MPAMRAAWYERYGPAAEVFQVGEMACPEPGPNEVRVRIASSGVNPSDVKSRMGSRGPEMPFPRIVPHSDGAGTIDAVGPGVAAARLGERVWTYQAQWQRPFGTAAEYVCLPAHRVVPLPDGVDFEQGACLAIPAMTAHRALFADGPIAGQVVLVTGGAGAVGSAAVQLAKWGRATVIATVSGDAKAADARQAGADVVLNYRTEDVAEQVLGLTGGQGVDRIVDVDFGGNLAVSERVLREAGTISPYSSSVREPALPYQALQRRNARIQFVLMYSMPEAAKRQASVDITAALEAGRLRHTIGARFPLAEIARAHEAQESGRVLGNVVVQIGE